MKPDQAAADWKGADGFRVVERRDVRDLLLPLARSGNEPLSRDDELSSNVAGTVVQAITPFECY